MADERAEMEAAAATETSCADTTKTLSVYTTQPFLRSADTTQTYPADLAQALSDDLSGGICPDNSLQDGEEGTNKCTVAEEKPRTVLYSANTGKWDLSDSEECKALLSDGLPLQSPEDGLPCYPVPIRCQMNDNRAADNEYLSIEDDLEDTSIDTIELNDTAECVHSSIKLNRDISCWVPQPSSTTEEAWPACNVNNNSEISKEAENSVLDTKQNVELEFMQMFSTTDTGTSEQHRTDEDFVLSEVGQTAGFVFRRGCVGNSDCVKFTNISNDTVTNCQQSTGRGHSKVHVSFVNSSISGVMCDVPQGGSLKAKINEWLKESKHNQSTDQESLPDLTPRGTGQELYSRQEDSCDNLKCDNNAEDSLHFSQLPVEIIQQIFSYFSHYELGCFLAPVCQAWRSLAYDPIHWQNIVLYFREDLELSTLLKMTQRAPLLKSLSLHGGFRLHWEELEHICIHCPLLQHLDLGFVCGVDHCLLLCLKTYCQQLVSLNVEGCSLVSSSCVTQAISKMKRLRHLNMSHCTLLEDENIMCLASELECLERLNIDGLEFITDRSIEELVRLQGNNLTHLDVDGAQMTSKSMAAMSRCPKLYRLSISFAELMTDDALAFIKPMTSLRELRIRKGHELTAGGLFDLFANGCLCELTLLDMTECAELDDQCAIQIATRFGKTLRHLCLEWCWDITDVGLEVIVEQCRSLEHLDLLGIEKLTGQCFEVIPEQLPKLVFLDLTQCNRIIDDIIIDTVRRKPDLKVTNYYGEELLHI